MIKNKATYNPYKLLFKYRYIVGFVFMLLLLAKPIMNIPLTLEESKYELVDTSEKENSSKSETVTDFEDENNYFYFYDFNNHLNIKRSLSYQLIDLSFLNFNIDIQIPPPRV